MSIPSIQLFSNGGTIRIAWEFTRDYVSYDLYYSNTGLSGSFVKIFGNIPATSSFGNKLVIKEFRRSEIGLSDAATFYVAIKGKDRYGSETDLSTPRIIPCFIDQPVSYGASCSPITNSENKSQMIPSGSTATRIYPTQDILFLEIFNNDDTEVLYVDTTGIDATVDRGLPVYPRVYYTVFRNISKDTGISLITSGNAIDARIIMHF